MPKQDFVWYELMTTDLPAAASFYRAVVGWKLEDSGMSPTPYLVIDGGSNCGGIGGLMQLSPEMQAAGAPATWISYIFAEDVDASAEALKAAGGTVHRAPADIPGVGRFAVVADPQGAIFNLFKPTPPPGVTRVFPAPEAPGNVGWRELMTSDADAAWEFYSGQFGWTEDKLIQMGEAGIYRTFSTTGDLPSGLNMTGGMMTVPSPIRRPGQPAAWWQFYFNVVDIHAASAAVEANGGTVTNGPMQVPGGSWVLNGIDPQGVTFAVSQPPAAG